MRQKQSEEEKTAKKKEYYKKYVEKHRDKVRMESRKYYENNREKEKLRAKKYYWSHRKESGEKKKKYRADHPEKIKQQDKEYSQRRADKQLDWHRKKKYGITREEYAALNLSQMGLCAICGRENSHGKSLGVDHNHVTGMIRGLLCTKCNLVIGNCNENIDILEKAIKYIKTYSQ